MTIYKMADKVKSVWFKQSYKLLYQTLLFKCIFVLLMFYCCYLAERELINHHTSATLLLWDYCRCVYLPVCLSSGIFGSSLLYSNPLPSPEPIANNDPGYHGNSTNPNPSFKTGNVTSSLRSHSSDDITYHSVSPSAATTIASPPSFTQATPTQSYTKPPDWLSSVTSLSTTWPVSTTSVPDTGNHRKYDQWTSDSEC